MKKILLFTLTGIMALFVIGCETVPETNSNTAVVTNDNTANVNENTETAKKEDDGDGGWIWDKDVKREDVDKDKDKYKKKAEEEESTIGSGANDLWLWTKTRSALATTDDLRDSTINVDVEDEVVTLKGTVGSAAQKASAVKVAKEIEGVKNVKDQLKVAKNDSVTNMNTSDNEKDTKEEANKEDKK